MEENQSSKGKKHKSAFSIQLAECVMAVVSITFSLVFAGEFIYHNAFPFGILDGVLIYAMISSIGVVLLGMNKYFSFLNRVFAETAAKILAIVVVLNFVVIALLYFSKSLRLSLYYFIVADMFLFLFLFFIKRISSRMKRGILKDRLTLVIGKNKAQSPILKALKKQDAGRLGFADFDHPDLQKYLDQADNIYLSGLLSKKFKEQVISYCVLRDKKVFVVPETYEIAMRKSEMTQVDDIPVFSIDSFRLTEAQSIVKRLCDILLAVTGIILSSPIMLYTVIRIKMEDGGPVFYRQVRSGLRGKEFHVVKFRSMIVDAEKHTGAVFANKDDPRITKFGRRMRAARIDEIPQFFNVLAGSMSMVGPRPERPVFVEEFSKELPEYTSRLAVKPGVTGLAQVMGNYTTSAYNKVKFDLVYIRNFSLWLDFKILVKTALVIFQKEQAAGFSQKAEKYPDDSLNPEEVFERAISPNSSLGLYRAHRVAKALGVVFCCAVVIIGSVFLRYSALAMTMMEAAIPADDTGGQLVAATRTIQITEPEASPEHLAVAASGESLSEAAEPQPASKEETAEGSQPAGEHRYASGKRELVPSGLMAGNSGEGKEEVGKSNQEEKTGSVLEVKNSEGKSFVLSGEEIKTALNQMTMTEKVKIGLDFLSKLNTADLMLLEKLAEGGFTKDEKEAAKSLMYERFDNIEVAYIKEVYREYVE